MDPCFVIHYDFFGTTRQSDEVTIELQSETANHFRARRIRAFEQINLFYPREYKVIAEVRRINLPHIDIKVIDWSSVIMPSPRLNLHWGLPERNKVSDALRVIGQFPVYNVNIGATDRSMNRDVTVNDQQRWVRALQQASEITGSGWIPELILDQPLFENKGLGLLCQEGIEASSPEQILKNNRKFDDISILIGPEGGFSDSERELAKENGWREVSLGRWNLTTEAAVFAVLSRIAPFITW